MGMGLNHELFPNNCTAKWLQKPRGFQGAPLAGGELSTRSIPDMHVQRNRSWRGGVKKKKGKGGKKEIERKGAIHTCIACSKNFCHVIKAVKFWPLLLLLLQNSFHPASGTCLLLAFPFVVF